MQDVEDIDWEAYGDGNGDQGADMVRRLDDINQGVSTEDEGSSADKLSSTEEGSDGDDSDYNSHASRDIQQNRTNPQVPMTQHQTRNRVEISGKPCSHYLT
jgi:hypothetical protein